MKRIALTTVALFLLAACGKNKETATKETATVNTEIMEKENKKQIEALLNTYETALNTSDAKLAQSLYTRDGIFMPSEAPSGIGAENILKSYEYVFSQIQLNIEFFIEEIVVEDNMAFAVTSSRGTVKIHANGVEAPEANRELFVFEKVDGQWKIARYMFNKTAPRE